MGRHAGTLVGLLLICAALLKVHELATSPIVANMISNTRIGNTLVACTELCMGFWLLSGWKGELSRLISIVLFCFLIVASGLMVIKGKASCGCFGHVHVPPIVTLGLDALVMCGLFAWHPKEGVQFSRTVFSICIVMVSCSVIAISQVRSVNFDAIGTVIEDGEMVVIEEDNWLQKPFPLSEVVDGDISSVLVGQWQVVIYHENCPKCRKLIEGAGTVEIPTAFIETPPYKSPPREDSKRVRWLKLTNRYEWFVSAPVIVQLKDGMVIGISD